MRYDCLVLALPEEALYYCTGFQTKEIEEPAMGVKWKFPKNHCCILDHLLCSSCCQQKSLVCVLRLWQDLVQFQLGCLLAVRSWADFITSLNLSFLVCKMMNNKSQSWG